MKTAFQSVQLGSVKFIVPFFMIYNPAILIGRGDPWDTVMSIIVAIIGIACISFALEGYLVGAGPLLLIERVILFSAGLVMFVPMWPFILGGILVSLILYGYKWQRKRNDHKGNELEV